MQLNKKFNCFVPPQFFPDSSLAGEKMGRETAADEDRPPVAVPVKTQ
jgi:hypothetical protein